MSRVYFCTNLLAPTHQCESFGDIKENILAGEDISGKTVWNHVKRLAGWVTNLTPLTLCYDGSVTTSPIKIANILKKISKTNLDIKKW